MSRYPAAAAWGLALALLFVLYETTIPFQFRFFWSQIAVGWERAVLGPFQGPGGVPASRSDLIGNVSLFVPLGFFLTLSPLFRRASRRRPLLLAGLGLLTSLAVECLQLFSPVRWAETSDLITNAFGTGLGILLALVVGRDLFDRACHWALRQLRVDPSALIWPLLTAIILLGALLPLDLSISRTSLLGQLDTARWNPWAHPPEGWTILGLGLIKQAWLFAFWGATAAQRWAGRRHALLQIFVGATLLALLAEGSHLFVRSRTLSVLAILVSGCGAGLGAGALLLGRHWGLSEKHLVFGVGSGYVIYLAADCLSPLAVSAVRFLIQGELMPPPVKTGPIPLLPTQPVPTLMALGNGLARMIRFVPLGLALPFLIEAKSVRYVTALTTAMVVLILELLVWHYSPWSGNLIEVGLAWVGISVGWSSGNAVAKYRSTSTTGIIPPAAMDR